MGPMELILFGTLTALVLVFLWPRLRRGPAPQGASAVALHIAVAVVVGGLVTLLLSLGLMTGLDVFFKVTTDDLGAAGVTSALGLVYLVVFVVLAYLTYRRIAR